MQHKGEILKKAINQQGFKVNRIAELLHRSRRSMYDLFANPNVPLDVIIEIENIIHYDFSEEIKELKKYKATHIAIDAGDQEQHYHKDYWKNKYLELLEKHTTVMEELAALKHKKERGKNKGKISDR